jgi:nucleoside-diphosphate-sugar epimerase
MKILVTGSAGTVGRPVCDELGRRGHAVRGFDRAPTPELADAVEAPDIKFEIVYAASRGGERVFDMEPARRLLGFEAQQRWPEGLPFSLPDG